MPCMTINWNANTITESGRPPRPITAEDLQVFCYEHPTADEVAEYPNEYQDFLADELDKEAARLLTRDADEIWDEEDTANHESWAADCRQAAQRLRARDFDGLTKTDLEEIDNIRPRAN